MPISNPNRFVNVDELEIASTDLTDSADLVRDAELIAALQGAAPAIHGHEIADVVDLQTVLNSKAATSHGHAISSVTGLQTALDNRSYLQLVSGYNRATHNGQSGEFFTWNTDGRIKRAIWRDAGFIEFAVDGTLFSLTPAASDARFKENIVYLDEKEELEPIQHCLDAIAQVRLCEFDWKPTSVVAGGHYPVGVIAQDLQQIAPQLVTELSDGTLQVNVGAAIPFLVGAIQELKARIEVLENR